MNVTLGNAVRRRFAAIGAVVALIGMLAVGAELGFFDRRYEKPASEVFGTKSGEPIATGFVFKDGAYLDAPYLVSRRGVSVYVNKVGVATPAIWPPVDYDDKRPETPRGLTRNSTFKDLAVPGRRSDSLDRQMVRWLRRHYDEETSRKLIMEYYRSLPFVRGVKVREDLDLLGHVLAISTWSTDKDTLMFIGDRVYSPPKPEQVQRELERVRTRMEDRLRKGECIFLFSSGGELAFGSRKAAMDLAAIVGTLRSDRPKDEKIRGLQNLGLMPSDFPKKWEILVTGFSASPQLDERVKQLRLPPGHKGEREPTLEEERAKMQKTMERNAGKEEDANK